MCRCQELTDEHWDQRMELCRWFIEEDIDPQLIIYSDEKCFSMNSAPNRQNFRHWAVSNPYSFEVATTKLRKKSCADWFEERRLMSPNECLTLNALKSVVGFRSFFVNS